MTTTPPGAAELEAARTLLLDRLGITPQLLIRASAPTAVVPTFDTFIERGPRQSPRNAAASTAPTGSKIRQTWGHRRIDEPTGLDIQHLAEHAKCLPSCGATLAEAESPPNT